MMAVQRERLYWLGGVYGVVVIGWLGFYFQYLLTILGALSRVRPVPIALKAAGFPLSLWG